MRIFERLTNGSSKKSFWPRTERVTEDHITGQTLAAVKAAKPNLNTSSVQISKPESDKLTRAKLMERRMQVVFSHLDSLVMRAISKQKRVRYKEEKRMPIMINYLVLLCAYRGVNVCVTYPLDLILNRFKQQPSPILFFSCMLCVN